jgi:hypothetical protein
MGSTGVGVGIDRKVGGGVREEESGGRELLGRRRNRGPAGVASDGGKELGCFLQYRKDFAPGKIKVLGGKWRCALIGVVGEVAQFAMSRVVWQQKNNTYGVLH